MKTKITFEITKHNYKAFGIQSRKEFRKYKKRALLDLQSNSTTPSFKNSRLFSLRYGKSFNGIEILL